ncbi:Variant surface glycoprotein [Trypanosoma congolense IL3000]|uniref:Variant surface glycoprotein n=1 Tax=Trypanosoma congolense (strain IL3000) TaxID=1068625 RepID=F9WAX1_TRYCI|nr:Variant surface glycoprotein [Trypanosoma congolense IL3000]
MTRMMMMKFWMIIIVSMWVSANVEGTDHNHDAHGVLCALLRVAVKKWEEVKDRQHDDTLKKALKQTIFGNESEKDMEEFRSQLPDAYHDNRKTKEDRTLWCGQPFDDDHQQSNANQPRWPGHSAPHDFVCLCTVGHGGSPLNKSEGSNQDTLCSKNRESLGGSGGKGWGDIGHNAEPQLRATWENVISKCLQGSEKKGEELKENLEKFMKQLKPTTSTLNPSRRQLGEGTPDDTHACTGSNATGVCVMYYPNLPPIPWYIQLRNALPEEEKFQEEKKKREEDERRKQKEEAAKKDTNKNEALKSATTATNQTEQNKTATLHETMHKLNITGSSSISMPSSWLLRAILLI